MDTREEVWRWLARGFGRIVGMLEATHRDPASGRIPDDARELLAGYVSQISTLLDEQGKRLPGEKP